MNPVDVAVVGGGPAGAAVALSLTSAGHSVVLLESSSFVGFRAGETLCPEAAAMLVQLGVWQQFLDCGPLPTHGIWSAWDDSRLVAKDLIFNPHGTAWRVDRTRFDRMLVAAAERQGARVELDCGPVRVRRDASSWRLTAGGRKSGLTIYSRFVVDATGRASHVARSLGVRRLSHDRLVAVIGALTTPPAFSVADDVLLIEATREGWWYRTKLPSGNVLAALLTDADLLLRNAGGFENWWKCKLERCQFVNEGISDLPLQALHVRSAAVGSLECSAGPGWIAVGDAANTIDPLSGAGIAKGIHSAVLASRAVCEAFAGNAHALQLYADQCVKQFDHSLKTSAHYAKRMQDRWSGSLFWSRRTLPRPA